MSTPTEGLEQGRSPTQRRRPLSPERVRTAEFSRTPLGRRGYNEDEVRQLLSRVAEDLAASDAEKAALRAEINRLRNYYREHRVTTGEHVAVAGVSGPSITAINLISQAQQAADAQVAQAEQYCRQIVLQAREHYEDVLREAANQAAERLGDVDSWPIEGGAVERDALERRIAWLRTFAEVTQVQLKSVLEALTQEVDKLGDLPEPTRIKIPVAVYENHGSP